jgi:CRP-like cAMP-binding protein
MRGSHSRPPAAEAFAAQAELITALQQRASLYTHPKGTVLFNQGDPTRGVYLLLEGSVRLLLHRDDNRTVQVRTVGAGYLLGLPGTILNRAYLFTAKLAQDSRVAFIESAELLDFLRQHSDLCFDVVELLGGELLDLPPAIQHRTTRNRHHRANA